MTTSRTDTHSPKSFNPAEYDEVGMFDNHHEDGFFSIDPEAAKCREFDGNYVARGRCDHCGAGPLRYGYVFLHTPTQQLVFVGTACAGRLGLSSRNEYETKKAFEAARREAQVAAFKAASVENLEVAAWLELQSQTPYIAYENDDVENGAKSYPHRELFPAVTGRTVAFCDELSHKLHRYGSLSEKQVAAVLKIKARNDLWLAERAAKAEAMKSVPALAEGRQEIEGEIVSTKWVDNDFGGALKMLVKLDDGNKLYGTVPNAIYAELPVGEGHDWFKGQRVAFAAAVERSRDDEHFGFYKRPTKARVIA